ncbi:hypothetical protein ACUUL3_16085 [Thiovibrio sp. JS02]
MEMFFLSGSAHPAGAESLPSAAGKTKGERAGVKILSACLCGEIFPLTVMGVRGKSAGSEKNCPAAFGKGPFFNCGEGVGMAPWPRKSAMLKCMNGVDEELQ